MEIRVAEYKPTYGVFVSGVAGPVEEFQERLMDSGMSEQVATEVIRNMPCFVKRDVPLHVAEKYKSVFESAGAWVMLENWQTTTNPAAMQGFVDRPSDEGPLEFAIAVGTGAGTRGDGVDAFELDYDDGEQERALLEPEPELELDDGTELKPGTLVQYTPRKWIPAGIAIGILLLMGSYVYGCARVAQKQGNFKDELSELNRVLENYNAKGKVVSQAMIVGAVQKLADNAGVTVDADEVIVTADRIVVQRHPYEGCVVAGWPDSVQYLSQFAYQRLLEQKNSCGVPRWIVGVRVSTRVRWGLASQRLVFEHHTPVLRYDQLY